MINTYEVEAIAGSACPEGKIRLVISDEQREAIIKQLQEVKNNTEPGLYDMITFFVNREGYVASDRIVTNYWHEHHD